MKILNKLDISIGIPVFNEEKNIEKLLESIKKQKLNFRKIIIVNDNSTDNTFNLIKKFKDENSKMNIKLINLKKNYGKAYALNIIFRVSNSEYLILLDSDICLRKDTIKNLIQCCSKKDIGLCSGWTEFKISKPNVIDRFYLFSSLLLKNIVKHKKIYGALGKIMCIKKDLYKKIYLPEKIVRIDAYIYLYSLSLGFDFNFCPNALADEFFYERGNIKTLLMRQTRSRSKPKIHFKKFGKIALEEFKEVNIFVFIKEYFFCFIKNPLNGFIWTILKLYFFVYSKIFKFKITHTWRKVEVRNRYV